MNSNTIPAEEPQTDTKGQLGNPTPTEIAFSSGVVTVLHRDGHKEEVTISMVKVSEFRTAPHPMFQEPEFLAYVCQRPLPWFDSLASGQYFRLLEEALRINSDFFGFASRSNKAMATVPADRLALAAKK